MSLRDTIHDAIDVDERNRAALRDKIRDRWDTSIRQMIVGIREHIRAGSPPHAAATAAAEAFLILVAEKDIPQAARAAAYDGYKIGLKLRGGTDETGSGG